MSDATLTQLTDQARRFVHERDWAQFHTPKDLAIGLSTEAAEVLEHFPASARTKRSPSA